MALINYIKPFLLFLILFSSCKSDNKNTSEKWIKNDSVYGDFEQALLNAENCKVLILRNKLPSGKTISNLKTIDKNIDKLKQLHTLKIYGLAQTEIPNEITGNTNLSKIEIYGYALIDKELKLPNNIRALYKLQSLTITGCSLSKMPILPMSIEYLDISKNKLSALKENELGLNLIDINASNNQITSLATEKNCNHLRRLNISENSLESLDKSNPIFSNLQFLSISNNPIDTFISNTAVNIEILEGIKIEPKLLVALIGDKTRHVWLSNPKTESEKNALKNSFPNVNFIWFQ